MANEYLDQLQADAGQIREQSNPYLDLLQAEQTGRTAALRGTLTSASEVNPDQYAQKKRVAGYLGYPTAAVEAQPHLETQARIQQIDELTQRTPVLRQRYTDQEFTKLAHDDAPNLSALEVQFREGLRTGRAAQGQIGGVPYRRTGTAQAVERSFLEGITEPVQRGYAQGRQGLTLLLDQLGVFRGLERQQVAAARAGGVSYTPGSDTAVMLANQQRNVERFPVPDEIQQGLQEISGAPTMGGALGAAARNPRAVLETALQSLGASTPALAGAAVGSTAGPIGTATGAGLGSFAVEYSSTLQDVMAEKGANFTDSMSIQRALENPEIMAAAREKALKRGIPVAIFDALTAGVAGRLLAGARGTVGSVAARSAGELGLQAGGGAAGEATAQAVTGEYKPGDILMEALAELPSAVVEVPGNFREARARVMESEQSTQFLTNLDQLAAASKVRMRDVSTFENFVAQAAEQGPVDAVYVDARTLAQSGVAEQIAAVSPSVAEQYTQALATGGDIRIPVEEYTARVAGTELSQPLLEHLKTEPGGMSRAEAQAFMETQTEALQAEVERVLGDKAADDAFKANAQEIKTEIKGQLDTLGRFDATVNDAYATLVGNFFAIRAAQLGITPRELYERFPLSVRAEGMMGEKALDQDNRPAEVKIRDAFREIPSISLGVAAPVTVTHNGVTLQFMARQDQLARGKNEAAIHLSRVKRGRMLAGDPEGWILESFKLDGKNRLTPEGMPKAITEEEAAAFKANFSQPGLAQSDNPSYNQDHGQVQDQSADRAGQVNATTVAGEPAERGWADATRATGDDGKPARLFRGAGRFLSPADFEPSALGVASGNPSSGLGVWFSFDEKEATKYGDVEDFHLDLRNPFYIRVENLPGFDSVEEATAWREKLRAQGYDGIYIDGRPLGGALNVVAFEPHQAIYPQLESLDFTGGELYQSGVKQTETEAFKRWFGDSKVVDENGDPLVVYRGEGGGADFTTFDRRATREKAFFFTADKDIAQVYANRGEPRAFYLKAEKVLDLTKGEEGRDFIRKWADVWGDWVDRETGEETDPVDYVQSGRLFDYEGDWSGERWKDLQATIEVEGYDGAVLPDWDNDTGLFKAIVVFDSTQIKSATDNRGTFDPNDPSILNQANARQDKRGYFIPNQNVIALLKQADLSTFLHESGHFFLETTFNLAAQPGAPAEIRQDAEALLKWFGVQSLDEWYSLDFEEMRPKHEQFARGFEAYLFEGKAPSLELQSLFQRFRAWMLAVYRDIKRLNVELTPEVRGVMDRMLATTEQIQLAEQGRSMLPLFETPEQAGMTPEEFRDYQMLGVDATNEAIQDLQARGLRDMAYIHNARGREIKRLQREADARRAEVRMEVRREVMSEQVYQAWQFLTSKGEEGAPAGKLRIAEITGDDATWQRLKDFKMLSKDGMHPDMVAEMFGFQSGDEMVRALAAADKPNDAIEALTDARMLEQYGELSSPEAIEREADRAIHNNVRARMVAAEVNALAKATGQRKILASAAKQLAETIVSRLKVREIRPNQYAAAETRAAKNAAEALKSNDLATAAAEKRNQLVNNYAARAAYDAQDEVQRGVDYLKKFGKDSIRKNLDADYTDQIDALLDRFDLRTGQSLKVIDQRTALAAWIKSQQEQGMEPDIPPELQNEAFRKSYKDMTVEEFRGLVDTVKQIEHLGRLKNRLLTAKEQREYAAARDEIVASINANANGRKAETRTPTDALGKLAKSLKRFWASHIKAATWARVMDGGKDGGAMWEYFIRTANERGDMETQMRADATLALSEILGPIVKKWPTIQGKGRYFESVGRAFTREGAMAVALNVGNAGNLQRLLGGEGWTIDQIRPILQSLTAEELRAVQAVWDHFESYRPQIAEKERRVYGKEPDWVEPTPFTMQTTDGETVSLKGGYYPIKYDPAASQRAEQHMEAEDAKRQMQGAYTSATTRRSFTKSRAEEVSGRPLLYSLIGVYSGVNDVIHDLAWHEWLIDANKLMRSQSIDAAIRTQYGPEVKAQFKQWINDVAQGEHRADNPAEVGVAWLRQGVSAAGLGFNVMSAAMQVLGFNQSIVRVGPGYIARGIAQYVASPVSSAREVVGKSKFMADRSRTQFRELNELRNQVEGQTAAGRVLTNGTYFLVMRAQKMVDVPTWLGAYEKAIAEGNGEERAIALADQAVIDSQGSGMVKDLSAIERGGKTAKLFTVFYSYMNTALNMGVQVGMTERNKAKFAAKMLMLYTVPAVLGSLLKDALTPGGGDDDPDKLARKLIAEQLSYLTGLMVGVREFGDAAKIVAGAEGARDYAGPAGTRMVGDADKFLKQAGQGEFDDAFRKASINLLGDLTGLPAAQINRTITGINALDDGETDNPAAVLFGYQR